MEKLGICVLWTEGLCRVYRLSQRIFYIYYCEQLIKLCRTCTKWTDKDKTKCTSQSCGIKIYMYINVRQQGKKRNFPIHVILSLQYNAGYFDWKLVTTTDVQLLQTNIGRHFIERQAGSRVSWYVIYLHIVHNVLNLNF